MSWFRILILTGIVRGFTALFSEVEKRFGTMCFTLRAIEDEKKGKLGVVECVKHDLLSPFPVMWEKEGEFVAQFKFTLLLMPNSPMRITSGPFDPELYKSEFSVKDPEMAVSDIALKLLRQELATPSYFFI